MKKILPFFARIGLLCMLVISAVEMSFGALADTYTSTTALSNRLVMPEGSYEAKLEELS